MQLRSASKPISESGRLFRNIEQNISCFRLFVILWKAASHFIHVHIGGRPTTMLVLTAVPISPATTARVCPRKLSHSLASCSPRLNIYQSPAGICRRDVVGSRSCAHSSRLQLLLHTAVTPFTGHTWSMKESSGVRYGLPFSSLVVLSKTCSFARKVFTADPRCQLP